MRSYVPEKLTELTDTEGGKVHRVVRASHKLRTRIYVSDPLLNAGAVSGHYRGIVVGLPTAILDVKPVGVKLA